MMSKEIDPNILRQNIKFIRELEYYPVKEFDEHESITPTTNKGHLTEESKKYFLEDVSRKLQKLKEQNEETDFFQKVKGNFKNQENLGEFLLTQEKTLEDFASNRIFIKKYQYKESKTSEVLRFGINIGYDSLIDELTLYNKQLTKTVSDAVQNKLEKQSDVSNISATTKYEPFRDKYIDLTSSERFIIGNAIKYLETSIHNVALVDVFPREFNNNNTGVGTINTKSLDTHTALLYKTTENKILVLDPNNPMFSSHLSKYQDTLYTIETLCNTDPKLKIYSRPEKTITGYDKTKYRDCIDIAVKIAFVLNNSGSSYKNLEDIMNSQVIKLITNNSNIDELIFTNRDLIRPKQSSNFEKVIDCNQKMTVYSTIEKLKREKALEDFTIQTNEIKVNYANIISKIDEEHTVSVVGMVDNYNPEL